MKLIKVNYGNETIFFNKKNFIDLACDSDTFKVELQYSYNSTQWHSYSFKFNDYGEMKEFADNILKQL